jgi:hypothetical protein
LLFFFFIVQVKGTLNYLCAFKETLHWVCSFVVFCVDWFWEVISSEIWSRSFPRAFLSLPIWELKLNQKVRFGGQSLMWSYYLKHAGMNSICFCFSLLWGKQQFYSLKWWFLAVLTGSQERPFTAHSQCKQQFTTSREHCKTYFFLGGGW